ncbi:MAG: DegV family protein [Anaerolineae bacterium]|nr:DegV family protein [Anaerolineae bacterium]
MSKAKVAVVVDSTAYIPQALVEQHNIHVIPLLVNWSGESLRDNVDITPDDFYKRLETAKEMPSTSQPSAGEFYDLYSKVAEEAESIVSIHISSELSGTVASAHAAAALMEGFPIEIVDSKSTSMGLGFMALVAAQAVENGATTKEAAAVARDLIPDVRVVFVVDTLEFLHRGGRIGGASRLFGSMLSIKPLLELQEGKIEALEKVRTKRKAVQRLLDIVVEACAGKSKVHAAVANASSPQEAQSVADELQKRLQPTELYIVDMSPVIGTHTGPGALGIAWYAED